MWGCRLRPGQRCDPAVDPYAREGVLEGSLALPVRVGCSFKTPIPGPVPDLPNQNLWVSGPRMDISKTMPMWILVQRMHEP